MSEYELFRKDKDFSVIIVDKVEKRIYGPCVWFLFEKASTLSTSIYIIRCAALPGVSVSAWLFAAVFREKKLFRGAVCNRVVCSVLRG